MRKLPLIAILLLGAAAKSFAGFDLGFAKEDGGQPGAFLDFAASARSLGMGGAHVAVADDASATYWNPAGLAQIDRKDIVTLYSALYEDTSFGFFGYAQPTVDMGTFGVGVVSLRAGDFEKRDGLGAVQGTFSHSDTALLLSYGVTPVDRFSIGTTVKAIRQEVDTYSDTAFGWDVAAMYEWRPTVQLGFAMHNILAPRLKLKSEEDKYPVDLRTGVKFTGLKNLLFAFDINQTANRSLKPHMGLEWTANDLLTLRAGLDETQITAGLGFKLGDWQVDYAFGYHDAASDIEDLNKSHRIGFHVNFGKKASDQEVSVRWQKKGEENLQAWIHLMDGMTQSDSNGIAKLSAATRQVIHHQGYLKPEDLYAAQGYIFYFEGEFDRSVQSLGQAASLKPEDATLAAHLEKARAEMTQEQTRQIVMFNLRVMREQFALGNWKDTLVACNKILSFEPENIEAKTFKDDAQMKITEPVNREMKIAKMQYEKAEYLDAIKSFNKVRELDPENQEAAQFITVAITELEKEAANQTVAEQTDHGVYQIERNPDKSRQLYNQGIVFYSQGKLNDAAQLWQEAIRLDAQNALARNAYNRARLELKEKP